jgi:uncharacterized protein
MNKNKITVAAFLLMGLVSIGLMFNLHFSFDFEQFFPKGDKDLDFYREFIKEFETDDNFLLVAVERKEGVFEKKFLEDFHDFTLKTRDFPYVTESQSLTKFRYPLRTPFAITTVPAIHIDDPSLYEEDKKRILQDERFVHNLISEDGKVLVIALKTANKMDLNQASELVKAIENQVQTYHFDNYHLLGRAFFQKEVVEMEKREVSVSTVIAGALVTIVLGWIFKRFWGTVIAMASILLGLLIFLGILSITGREMSALAALYPVLMLILGTFDTIHVMSKYIDERQRGLNADEAVKITIKDMALPTFLTYSTTAIGFLALITNNIQPVVDFGINATIGVTVAYAMAMVFVPACLSFFELDDIMKISETSDKWKQIFHSLHFFTKKYPKSISIASFGVFLLTLWGISLITTNYRIESQLPTKGKVTEDFLFFEKHFAGFRPVEFAIFAQNDHKVNEFAVVKEIEKVENEIRSFHDFRTITSITAIYKSINQMNEGGALLGYRLPQDSLSFAEAQYLSGKLPKSSVNILVSKDERKTRIATRINDIGADSVKLIGTTIENWVNTNIDSNLIKVKRTGTGLLIDKNAEYIRDNTIYGMFWTVLIIGILMAFILRRWQMMFIFLIPNLFPLFMCGALMGFIGIELEAGVSMIFSVIFGIAVDDTIHTLSKFKVFQEKGLSVDDALYETMQEVGRPMIQTAIILFFGFLVMLFSIHPPSVNVGLLMSLTLAGALLSDLFLLPVMVRWLVKDK